MVLLVARKQVVIALEDVAGTTPSGGLTNAANANILLNSGEVSFEIDQIDREYLRKTISKLKSIPGQKTGTLTLTTELVGNSDDAFASGVPAWDKLMRLAGYRRATISKVRIHATTHTDWSAGDGPIRHGEIITDNETTPATARVVGDVHFGSSTLYYEDWSAPIKTSGIVTTSDTGFQVDTLTTEAVNCGWAWIPVSEPLKQVTTVATLTTVGAVGALYRSNTTKSVFVLAKSVAIGATTVVYRPGSISPTNNEVYSLVAGTGTGPATITMAADKAETFYQWPTASVRFNEDGVACDFTACRANVAFQFDVNRPVIITATIKGKWTAAADLVQIADSTEVITPKLWAGVATELALNETLTEQDDADNFAPCLKSLTLDSGVTLNENKCASAVDGLDAIFGGSRSGSGSLEANATFENEQPWLGTLRSGEVTRLLVPVGGDVSNVNGFQFLMPALQETSVASGDADTILTRAVDFSLNAAVINNLGGSPAGEISSTKGDNELILIYDCEALA